MCKRASAGLPGARHGYEPHHPWRYREDRNAPDEIHGIARVHGAVATGGDGQDRLAGPGGCGRGRRRTRNGQRDRGRAAGVRGEDPRWPASVDVRRVRRELHRRRREGNGQARRRLLEGLGGGGLPGPGRRVLLRAAGPGTRGDRARGRRPRLLATRFRSRGRGGGAGGLRPDRGPGDRSRRPRPGEDRPLGAPRRGPPVGQGAGRRGRRDRHRAGHGGGARGGRFGGPGGHAVHRCGGEGHDPHRGVLRELAERAPSRPAFLCRSGRAVSGRVRRRDRTAVGSRCSRSRTNARLVRRRQDDNRDVRRDAPLGRRVRGWREAHPEGGRDSAGTRGGSRDASPLLGKVGVPSSLNWRISGTKREKRPAVLQGAMGTASDRPTTLVTGANRGLGLETSVQLRAKGFRVVLTSRDEKKGTAAVRGLDPDGGDALYHQLDITDRASISSVAKDLPALVPRLDLLVNNAGIGSWGADRRASVRTIATNYFGSRDVTDTLLPFIPDGGRIVMVSSGLGELSYMGRDLRPRFEDPSLTRPTLDSLVNTYLADLEKGEAKSEGWPSAYSVSKVAMNALTRILARELAPRKISINSVCPGWVRTDMGGPGANRSVPVGARSIVLGAMLPEDATGGFYRDGKRISW